MINNFINNNVQDSDVAKEPRTELALVFIYYKNGLNFLLPVIAHAFFILTFRVWARDTLHREQGRGYITPAADTIYLCFVLDSAPEHLISSSLLNQVGSDTNRPSYNEIPVLEKR
jgi:hypothetical protein